MAKLSLLALLGIAHGYFVTVQPRKEECFHEYVKNNDKINMMYEVSDNCTSLFMQTDWRGQPEGLKLISGCRRRLSRHKRESDQRQEPSYLQQRKRNIRKGIFFIFWKRLTILRIKMLFTADAAGPIRFCFSNKISTVTHKVVMFSIDVTEAAAAGEEDEDETHSKVSTRVFLLE